MKRITVALAALIVMCLLIASASADTIHIPSGLTEIPESMFEGSQALDHVDIGDNITSIGSKAFAHSSIATVSIPKSVTSIADDAFDDCDLIAYVYSGTYAAQYCLSHRIPTRAASMQDALSLYVCEKPNWTNSDFDGYFYRRILDSQRRYTIGECVATVFDVETKMTFTIRRVGGDLHADIEPYTRADTEAIYYMLGISKLDSYGRRPAILCIGTRLFACSLYVEGHSDSTRPSSEVLLDNGLDGDVMCLWVDGCKSHKTGKPDSSHQAAVNEAYNWWWTEYGSKQ